MVNLNTASRDELERVPQIGKERADELVRRRPFSAWEDVKRVPGFEGGMVENLRQSGVELQQSDKR